jgi:hypothetical protein
MAFSKWKLRNSSGIHKMNPGEFMVTSNTTPPQYWFGSSSGNKRLPDTTYTQTMIDTEITAVGDAMTTNVQYVDGSRTDEYTADGSTIYPYKTITAAITAANSGDTIYIWPGTYTEDLTLKPGVNLAGQSKFSVYIVGTVTFNTAGTVCCERIIFKTSGAGNTLNFAGTGVQNLQCVMCNFEHTSGDGHCIYWTNTNASSKIQQVDGNITQAVSSGGGTAFTSTSTAAGGIILQIATVQVLDDTDNVCVNHGGAVVWTHTSDALNGQFVTADTARFNFKDVALTAATVVNINHLSTNATPSAVLNCAVTTYKSGVSIDGTGALVFAAIIYGGTGVGGAATLNGGLGAIPLAMAPIRLRSSALLPAGSVAAGQLDGTVEYDGTKPYFTAGTTRNSIAIGEQASLISDPADGSTIDAESRTAINAIIDALQSYGIVAGS